jgi:hypothetical protein
MPFGDAFAGKKLFHVKNPLFNDSSSPRLGFADKFPQKALSLAIFFFGNIYYTLFYYACQVIIIGRKSLAKKNCLCYNK